MEGRAGSKKSKPPMTPYVSARKLMDVTAVEATNANTAIKEPATDTARQPNLLTIEPANGAVKIRQA